MPFAAKITAAAKGQAADFTAEEQDALKTVATAATKIISQSQNFTAEELANNANVLANAKGLQKVAESMGAMVGDEEVEAVDIFGLGDELKALANTFEKLESKLWAFKKEQIAFRYEIQKKPVSDADFKKGINSFDTQKKELLKEIADVEKTFNEELDKLAIKYHSKKQKVKTIELWSKLNTYKSKGFIECVKRANSTIELDKINKYRSFLGDADFIKANHGTIEALFIASGIETKPLEYKEREIATEFSNNLLALAEEQKAGKFPPIKINKDISRKEMGILSGDEDNFALMELKNGLPIISIAAKCKNVDASIAHELQHLIQYRKGELAYWGKNNNPLTWIYDRYDEVEAHQVQFLVEPNSLPIPESGVRITDITKIDCDYLYKGYSHLPCAKLSLSSTFEEIDANWKVTASGFDSPKVLLPTVGDENNVKFDWEKIKNMKFIDFLVVNKKFVKANNIFFTK
jgi:hypothetical protein